MKDSQSKSSALYDTEELLFVDVRQTKMRKIIVSAYGCEPNLGSEQGVGWNWVLQMAKRNKLFVITRANNRENIEGNVPPHLSQNIEFYYYDTPKIFRSLKKKAKGLYFYYFFWQIGIASVVRSIIKTHKPDYTMHLTFGSMWMPTLLPLFKTPFIWGPIGGGDCEPKSFFAILPIKQRVMAYFRLLLNSTILLNPFIMFNCFRSKAIICRTQSSSDVLGSMFNKKKHVMLETAMESIPVRDARDAKERTVRILSTGRLMPSKNIVSAVRALSDERLQGVDFVYNIIGSGPEKSKLKQEIKRLDLVDKVNIIDNISRDEVLKYLSESDIYLFPSLREGGSWAIMEAMAMSLPVICLDWSGMSIITDDKSAIRLPVSNPKQMPIDMANAIVELIENRSLSQDIGAAARNRIIEKFNWDEKGIFMEELFESIEK